MPMFWHPSSERYWLQSLFYLKSFHKIRVSGGGSRGVVFFVLPWVPSFATHVCHGRSPCGYIFCCVWGRGGRRGSHILCRSKLAWLMTLSLSRCISIASCIFLLLWLGSLPTILTVVLLIKWFLDFSSLFFVKICSAKVEFFVFFSFIFFSCSPILHFNARLVSPMYFSPQPHVREYMQFLVSRGARVGFTRVRRLPIVSGDEKTVLMLN